MIPALAVAYWVSTHSAQLGAQMPTRSPLRGPAPRSPRERVHLRVQLLVGQPDVLESHDERLTVAEPRDGAFEVLADRLADQRLGGDAGRVGPSHDA
jgi:hypothetical protein